ncbi:2-methylcitrate dehydratase PrpD [Marasmius fiardii PR-910]|nr:2-methylcitrate dehydratase PrpD [Marasmius fiardii PR-910]
MATLALASWATNLTYANLTAGVVDAAVKSVYNWAGCAIGGYAQDAPHIAQNTTQIFFGGPPTSSILGFNGSASEGSVDAQLAAFINGIAGHVDDYDDTHLETIIHPAGTIASALLAVAEWKGNVTGEDFLTAFVAGVETELKLGLSVWPEHYDVGWHDTSTTGSIGAAVAVGRLINLDTTRLQHAIGVASTQVIGMQEFFGSMTKSFHVGRAAQSGMLAALLAQNGFTSSLQPLEAQFGWLHVMSTRENAKKSLSSIQSINLHVNPEVLVLTGKTDPQTGLESKFSIYHAAAVGLLFGEATPTEFTDDIVKNDTVVGLRKKVNVTTDATVAEDQADISITFEDGSTLEQHIEHAIGSLENPLTEADLKKKFLDQVSRVIGEERAELAYAAFTNIGNMTDVGKIRMLF